ncbi:hypothetical protein KC363_g6769 [Hortaea werneckii]|uniref:G-patch domain-containing protein n=1 Tax=Hortaea werneckii TaxID=91943 RepID=A0A3M7F923_HORWE|nr:hypothetical protein KC361_g6995 [Hortaea werneckii]KAI7186136.1 hypothetical protein KC363_g6769 [Hortaea werneckii]RMY84991.1 hypothetical protein D0861_06688 [Hortaea werneckii]
MGDNYRPRRSPPFPPRHGGGWQHDYERPPRGAYYRDASTSRERRISSDFYDERQQRPSSSRSSDNSPLEYDENSGFRIRGRTDPGMNEADRYRDRDASPAYRDESRGYRRRYDSRDPPYRRPYRGPRYEEIPAYSEEPLYAEPPNRGENDISTDGRPLRLLLLRGLKESTSEDLLAKGLQKLESNEDSEHGAAPGSLRRVMLIRDRVSGKGVGFGFAEYHSVSAASTALAKAEELGDKFTISSKVVEVNFPHLTVFPRADFGEVSETAEKWTVVMPATGARHRYHDERYYPSELIVNEVPPNGEVQAGQEKPGRQAAAQAHSSVRGTPELKDKSSTVAGKKRKELSSSMPTTVPAFLQHWQNKAAELRSEDEKAAAEKERGREAKRQQLPASGVNTITPSKCDSPAEEVIQTTQPLPESSPAPQVQTFSIDTDEKKCCYLCLGQFQTSANLQRHLLESGKHAGNLQNDAEKAKGYERLKKVGVSETSTIKMPMPFAHEAIRPASSATSEDVSQYRDRAAERRREQAQTGIKENVSFSLKGNKASAAKKSSPAAPEPSKPTYGKGMNLLQKAGWSAGQGLGSQGEGMAAPIDQAVYAAGVGLGHESSKKGDAVEEAEKMTKGDRGGFLEATKRVARERYDRMN